jgi:hypothetical protein
MVKAVNVSPLHLDIWEYVKADVADAPQELPDGCYELASRETCESG